MGKSLFINGMNCAHCTGSVEKALHAVPGVKDAKVDLASKTAVVNAENCRFLVEKRTDSGRILVASQSRLNFSAAASKASLSKCACSRSSRQKVRQCMRLGFEPYMEVSGNALRPR